MNSPLLPTPGLIPLIEKQKILVIDGNQQELERASEQLAPHDVMRVQTFAQAEALLMSGNDMDAVLIDLFLRENPDAAPVGIFLALIAAEAKAKYIGLIADKGDEGGWEYVGMTIQHSHGSQLFGQTSWAVQIHRSDKVMTSVMKGPKGKSFEAQNEPAKNWRRLFDLLQTTDVDAAD